MTAMLDAFIKAGWKPAHYVFGTAVVRLIQSGGTFAKARELVDAVEKLMSGKGHLIPASDGQRERAQPRHTLEDAAGQGTLASDGQGIDARPSSSDRGGRGHGLAASDGQSLTAPPVRETSRTKRGLASIKSAQQPIHRGYLMLHKTSGRKPWGLVGWHELYGMRSDGGVAKLILERVAPPANHFEILNNILTDAQFMEIENAAKKQISSD